MNLTKKTILITGGATGIGLALARQLVARANRVVVCGRTDESLRRAQAEVPELIVRQCDVTDEASRHALVSWLHTAHPDLNLVINNAGVQHRRTLTESDALFEFEMEVAINFVAPVRLIAELMSLLRRQPEAAIVNVTSGLAFAPLATVPIYCATKAALHSYTLSLRHQLKNTQIKVIEVAPPIVGTGLGGANRKAATLIPSLMSADDFAMEALARIEAGHDEVLVGSSANTRKMGDALFDRMNPK